MDLYYSLRLEAGSTDRRSAGPCLLHAWLEVTAASSSKPSLLPYFSQSAVGGQGWRRPGRRAGSRAPGARGTRVAAASEHGGAPGGQRCRPES